LLFHFLQGGGGYFGHSISVGYDAALISLLLELLF